MRLSRGPSGFHRSCETEQTLQEICGLDMRGAPDMRSAMLMRLQWFYRLDLSLELFEEGLYLISKCHSAPSPTYQGAFICAYFRYARSDVS